MSFAALIEPLHQAAHHEARQSRRVFLAVHDWSTLSFGRHQTKADRATLTHGHDVGYDLATVLMVRDDGAPIAPVDVRVKTADGVLHTRGEGLTDDIPHVDQVLPAMRYVRAQDFEAHIVHVVDREADSVSHWRQWSGEGHLALVRADDRKVRHQGQETTLKTIAGGLSHDGAFRDAGEARYHGRRARLFVAETEVVLHRPGKRNVGDGRKVEVPGEALPLRLVVTEVRDAKGRVLARWLLLSNVPAALADTATLARWYYFRWRIEGMHKLLKRAGWQLESWLQRDAARLLRKLLLAFGACAAIWSLERRNDRESVAFQEMLMQLSGRQTKRDRRITTSGMLAGLWVLQAALGPLAQHDPDALNTMMEKHLPAFATPR